MNKPEPRASVVILADLRRRIDMYRGLLTAVDGDSRAYGRLLALLGELEYALLTESGRVARSVDSTEELFAACKAAYDLEWMPNTTHVTATAFWADLLEVRRRLGDAMDKAEAKRENRK